MSVSRVRYRERQILRQDDLNDEQAYRQAMRRRHNIGHHGWGIVSGLTLSGGTQLQIEPGLAVDGFSRTLILPHPVEVSTAVLEKCVQENTNQIDVWLLYAREPELSKQNGRYPCGPGRHNRWREEARVRLEAADDEPVNPRRPEAVATANRDFGPHRPPPDDPDREWPVYLGRIERSEGGVELVDAARPFATLYGAAVTAPSGRARLQVENELAGARRVFAVSTADHEGKWQDRLVIERGGETAVYGDTTFYDDLLLAHPVSLFQPEDFIDVVGFINKLRLPDSADELISALHDDLRPAFKDELATYDGLTPPSADLIDDLIAEMNLILHTIYLGSLADYFDGIDIRQETGDLLRENNLEGAALIRLNRLLLEDAYPDQIRRHGRPPGPPRGLALKALESDPESAKPWQIYHTAVSIDEIITKHQLHFEIAHPGQEGDPKRYKLSIGHSEAVDTFSPCFIVRADGTVIVKGNINLDGELIEGPIPADPRDPRFADVLLEGWLGGISSAANKVDAFYSNAPEVTFVQMSAAVAGGTFSYRVSLTNAGQENLENFQVIEVITMPGASPVQTEIDSNFSLVPGASHEIDEQQHSVPNSPGEIITLVVTAIGTRQDGFQIQASASESITIIPGDVVF